MVEKREIRIQNKKANLTGYRGYVVRMDDYEEKERIWMRKEAFLLRLKDMLPDFRVEYKYAKTYLLKTTFYTE